jgi:Pyruvate/2-oxoacid:ferredoxin oxidoreductase delta subunit
LSLALTYEHRRATSTWAPASYDLSRLRAGGGITSRAVKANGLVGFVHYYKDAMLGRFYAICNCCSCCCGAMQACQNGTPMLASSGFVAQVDAELCAACGTCADYCQFAAVSVDDGFARIDAAACMGCGVCVSKCPEGAPSLQRAPDRGQPLEIQQLIARAAQVTGR